MKKNLISASVATLLAVSAFNAVAEEAASPLSFNVSVVSDYVFRGISQTHHDPALQGGVDYAFSNGFYVGAWASSISWVKDALGDGSMELDLYGGYKGAINNDWSYDVGAINYTYPGHGKAVPTYTGNPTSAEVYGSLAWKWLSAKYSHTVSNQWVGIYGGAALDQKTRGSNYLELNANYDLGDGWIVIGHVGHQKVENSVSTAAQHDASYSDWKIGVTKDVGFGVVGLSYSDTDAKGSCSNPFPASGASAYCWGTNGNGNTGALPTSGYKKVSDGVAILSFTKTF